MSRSPRLVVDGVTVRWGEVVAVDAADLAVAPGEVVALLGPSGCGKSSLLAAIAGLVPHAGTIALDGVDVTGRRPDQRDLGLMFQDGALFPHLDVGANVAFGLRMHGWDRSRRAARVAEVLDLVGLRGLSGRRVDALSGGQAQRVALARAIAPQPRLLLLDEPLSSLDARLRDRLLEELPAVFAAVDAAVVHVTHDQDEAMALADRVAVMHDGRIVRLDEPARLWDDPRTTFVAEFLGWRNVFAVGEGDATGEGEGPHPHLDLPSRLRRRLGDPARVGVDAARVEVVAGSPSPATGDTTTWPGRVVTHRFAGDHVTMDVALEDRDRSVGASRESDGQESRRADEAPSRAPHLRATGPVHAMPGTDRAVTVAVPDDAWRALSPD